MPVLKVKKNGVWETVAGGGSSAETFIVEIDVDNETASHTPSEIAAAKEAGKIVVGRGKSSLLFDGTIFNLFEANEIRAVFEYTRSTLSDVDTYRYEIDGDKKATLTSYSLDIGPLSDLTTTNKESIVKAINEVAASAGESGESEVLIVTADTSTMTASHSSAEILDAADSGKAIFVKFDESHIPYVYYADATKQAVFVASETTEDEVYTVSICVDDAKIVTVKTTLYSPSIDQITATVGQIAKVKTVDDSGKPTEWEAVDMPSGSSESDLFLVTISDDLTTASHSASEINAAISGGKIPLLLPGDGSALGICLTTDTRAEFSGVVVPVTGLGTAEQHYTVDDAKAVTFNYWLRPSIPDPTESDYGKVLSATADGLVWVAQSGGSAVPSAEGVEF